MAENETNLKKSEPKGFDAPIPKSHKGALPDHVDPETRMAKGIAPDSKDVISVNLGVLQAKHGKKDGMDRYTKIAKAGGFFDPSTEPVGSAYFPDLQIEGLASDIRKKIDAILNEAD